jgi:hypothetical protein
MHPIQDESSDANSISKRLIELRNAGLTPMETIKALRGLLPVSKTPC